MIEQLLKDRDFNEILTNATQKVQEAGKKILEWIVKTSNSHLYDAYLKYLFKIWTSVPPSNGYI